MDALHYRRLCALLDDLLLQPPVPEHRVAVSRLHMIRNHPVYTDGYADLFADRGAFADAVHHRVERVKRLAIIALHLGRVAANRLTARSAPALDRACDVLVVSYQFSAASAGNPDDMYFGRLAQNLESHGLSTVVARFDSTPGLANANRAASPPPGHVLLDKFLALSGELRAAAAMWRQSGRLRRQRVESGDPIARRLPRFAANDAVSMWSLSNLRRVQLVAAVLRHVRPKVLLTTYEGLPWERLLYARARAILPGVTCAGYQQAPLFHNQHAIARAIGAPYDPDIIFTSSEDARRQLDSIAHYTATSIEVLGSKRHRPGPPAARKPITPGRPAGILVVPEGIPDECLRMFTFARQAATLMPDCTFIWRLHPNTTFDEFRRCEPALFAGLPSNVTLSRADFSADVDRAHVALYRGSSAIINCINEGLMPVYLAIGGSDDIDPLYSLGARVARIHQPRELLDLIRRPPAADPSVSAFASDYYGPLDAGRLASHVRRLYPHESH